MRLYRAHCGLYAAIVRTTGSDNADFSHQLFPGDSARFFDVVVREQSIRGDILD